MYAISKLAWIKRKREELAAFNRQSDREYVSGENHYYKGKRYRLKVINQHLDPHIELKGNQYLLLYVRQGATVERKEAILKEWYRQNLKQIIEPLVGKWERLLDVEVESWDILHMKTQWGSCSTKRKTIHFNLELIKKPLHCIEYVIAHELSHLIERNHNDKFIALLDYNMPNWRNIKNELNEFIV